MSVVAGVDCSSKNIAVFIMDQDKKRLASFYFESTLKDPDSRLDQLIGWADTDLSNAIDFYHISFAAVENPVYLSNPIASSGIAQVIGYVKSVFARKRVPFMGIDNMSWKKAVLGSGKASKEEIMKLSVSNWGTDQIKNQDLADASCVALWASMRKV
jgi:crossover junction endodeoxyribonuclease RuvC